MPSIDCEVIVWRPVGWAGLICPRVPTAPFLHWLPATEPWFHAAPRLTFLVCPRKVSKGRAPRDTAPTRDEALRVASPRREQCSRKPRGFDLCFSYSPGHGLTGHPRPGSPRPTSLSFGVAASSARKAPLLTPCVCCDARRSEGGGESEDKRKHSNVQSFTAAFDSFLTLLLIPSPFSQPSIADPDGQARRGEAGMPKPFWRARDGASMRPGRTEKHREPARAVVSCESAQRRGPIFSLTFFAAKKVSRATARNVAQSVENVIVYTRECRNQRVLQATAV